MTASEFKELPVFEGWTVDLRLKEFRKADPAGTIVFLSFYSNEGDELLARYIDQLEDQAQLVEILTTVF